MWASYQTAGFENVICGSFASNAWPDLLRFGPTTHELLPLNCARPGNNGSLFSAAKRRRSIAMLGTVAAVFSSGCELAPLPFGDRRRSANHKRDSAKPEEKTAAT